MEDKTAAGSMPGAVIVDRTDGIMTVTINRPEVRNAINREVAIAIDSAMDELDASDELLVGIITGAGGTFCAGMDLKAFLAGEDVETPTRGFAGMCSQPSTKPLIAAVEGWALAGGCEIALACDLIVAAEDAQFGLPEVKRGLFAAAGGLLRLPRRVPVGLAMRLALTGDPIDVSTAAAAGLVCDVTPNGGALVGALELARRIATNGPLAVAASKEVILRSTEMTLRDGFAMQHRIKDSVFDSADAREGALAFTQKRPPHWQRR